MRATTSCCASRSRGLGLSVRRPPTRQRPASVRRATGASSAMQLLQLYRYSSVPYSTAVCVRRVPTSHPTPRAQRCAILRRRPRARCAGRRLSRDPRESRTRTRHTRGRGPLARTGGLGGEEPSVERCACRAWRPGVGSPALPVKSEKPLARVAFF